MEEIKTILIEDEPLAREALKAIVSKNTFLKIVGTYESSQAAKDPIILGNVDLVLSDIQMPDLNGLVFLRSLENPPLFVFVTAHPQFAIEAFDLDVIDYILKPNFTVERLSKVVEKVKAILDYKKSYKRENILKFKDGRRTIFLHPNDIVLIKSYGDYVRISTADETVTVKSNLKILQNVLPMDCFIRIHRSHIIHLGEVKTIDAARVTLKNGEKLEIGLRYRDQLYKKMGV